MHADIKATMQMEKLTRAVQLQWRRYFKLSPVKISPIYFEQLECTFPSIFYGGYSHGQNILDKYWFSYEIRYYGKSSIPIFQGFFAIIDKIFILGGRLGTRL